MTNARGKRAIGIDVGGTWTRVAVVGATRRVLASRKIPTPGGRDGRNLIPQLAQIVSEVRQDSRVGEGEHAPICLALPGVVDREHDVVLRSVNLPVLEDPGFVQDLASRIGCRPTLITDADAATWGEYACCMPRPDPFIHLRLGTGVACGVVVDGELEPTGTDRKTHWDVLVIDEGPDARPCACGLRGCLETVVSWSALERAVTAAGLSGGIAGLRRANGVGDIRAADVIRQAASALAKALGNLYERFQPESVSLGGGVIDALPVLVDAVAASLNEQSCHTDAFDAPTVEQARLGDDAGVIGAGLIAMAIDHRATPPA